MTDPAAATTQIDNARVRVTEWRFAPGASTGAHHHQLDYVVVPGTTGKLAVVDADGGETVAELTAGLPYFREAGAHHEVVNINDHPFVFVEIELL